MDEITRMMGNVTSAVCGRAINTTIEQGPQRKTSEPGSKKTDSRQNGKARNTLQLRNKTNNRKSLGKHVS